MEPLVAAIVVAVAAWIGVVAAIFLPIADAVFRRLQWVGSAAVALVALALLGAPFPAWGPPALVAGGAGVAFAWPAGPAGGKEP